MNEKNYSWLTSLRNEFNSKKIAENNINFIKTLNDGQTSNVTDEKDVYDWAADYEVGDDVGQAYPLKYNLNKRCFVCIGGPKTPYDRNGLDNWKKKDVNGLFDVDDKVMLFPTDQKFAPQYSLTLKDAKDGNPAANFANKANSLLETAKAFTEKNRSGTNTVFQYQNPKIWGDAKALKINGNISFDFTFGQFGIFSGLEEVVKPIMALGAVTLPHDVGNGRFRTPYPTGSEWVAQYLSDVIKSAVTSGKDLFESSGSSASSDTSTGSSGLIQMADNFMSKYYEAVRAGAKSVITSGKYAFWNFKLGHFIFGPCTISSVDVSFNLELLDEYGWPSSGKITIGGIEGYATATRTSWEALAFNVSADSDKASNIGLNSDKQNFSS